MTLFLRLVDADTTEKGERLKAMVRDEHGGIQVSSEQLRSIPGSPFAYWVGDDVRELFRTSEIFESGGRIARKGLTTSDDDRYVRSWWEVSPAQLGSRWADYAKGGEAVSFHAHVRNVVRWNWDKRTIPGYTGRAGRQTETVECADLMGRPGLTWPLRAASFTPSVLPEGCVFSARGYVIQASRTDLGWILGLTASNVFDYLFKTCLGRTGYPEFIVGVLQELPIPHLKDADRSALEAHAFAAWSAQRTLHSVDETARAFNLPQTLTDGAVLSAASARLAQLSAKLCVMTSAAYGLAGELAISDTLPSVTSEDEVESEGEQGSARDEDSELLSWSVGVTFGRFDIRLATSERKSPLEPAPFDRLPVKSPGMVPDGDTPFVRSGGVYVDDMGHPEDFTTSVTAVYDRIGEAPPAPDQLRSILAKDFFATHIRMYSKSRRKAPIYWQLATPSASYSVWLYIHAFSKDTLFRVRNDYVAPKLEHERRQLATLRAEAGASPTSAQSRAIETQAVFVDELAAMLDEVSRVAPLWDPDLDDGVIINFAPLWRLVPHQRPWQNELRATWTKLVEGEYDWARLAMRLWPERVVPKCAEDRSLAIAHDLEDVFWFEDDNGKWRNRDTPTHSVAALIAERTSSAVKAAVASIVEAPDPLAATRRRGRTAR